MKNKLRQLAKSVKAVGKCLMTFAVVGMMVLSNPMETEAMGPSGETAMLESDLRNHPDAVQEMLDLGFTLIIVSNSRQDQEIMRLVPGMRVDEVLRGLDWQPPLPPRWSIQQPLPNSNLELLSRVPALTAPRDSTPTNYALRDFLLDFIDTYIVAMQNENQGAWRSGMTAESLRFSEYFMQGYRRAMGMDTASRALGLNSVGMDMFYDSKTVDFFTRTRQGEALGTFGGRDRLVSIAINTINSGVLSGRTSEQIATVIVYEIDGRGRGWNPALNFALAEHFGLPNTHINQGLMFDPAMEVAASSAAGGIHTLFEAADNGTVRDLMNANFRNANQHFNFDYDTWQMARSTDFFIRTEWHTNEGQIAGQAVRDRGGSIMHLQSVIDAALDPTLTPAVRRQNAERVNRYVAMLAEIGMSLEVWQWAMILESDIPVVDVNNLDRGIVGSTGHFPNMTERVSGN